MGPRAGVVLPIAWTEGSEAADRGAAGEGDGEGGTPSAQDMSQSVSDLQRTVRGIDAVIRDTCSLDALLQSLGDGTSRVRAAYRLGVDPVVSDRALMCRWEFFTENAVACGAACEVASPRRQ